jgi:hypothetical protein
MAEQDGAATGRHSRRRAAQITYSDAIAIDDDDDDAAVEVDEDAADIDFG